MFRSDAVHLLQIDPELGRLVPPDRREDAVAGFRVPCVRLRIGAWDVGGIGGDEQLVGLLVLSGILAREVVVADNVSTELLGPGDVIRPWQGNGGPDDLLPNEVRWTALADTRLAVLERRFAAQAVRHPEVNWMLMHRITERAHRLATAQAVSQLTRVDRRLLALMWHLAERWGRVCTDGVIVPLALSHRILGQLVGARRPTVSSALSDLARREELVRREDGSWLLAGDPPEEPDAAATALVQARRQVAVPARPTVIRPRATVAT